MKRVVAALLCLLVLLGAALYLFVVRPLLRPSEMTAVAEGALATEDLLLLGGVNVKQAAFLEKWFLGAPQVTAVREEPAPPVADRTLFDHLRAAGVDARHDVDHALYALYPASGEAARHAVVLVGRFNPAAINAYLTRELKATPRAGSAPPSFEVARTDPATCEPGATWVVTVTPEWIVLADPASHPALLARFASPPAENKETLGWWRGLARSDVVGVGIPGFDRLETGTAQPFMKSSAKALAAQADAFGRVYLGLGVKTIPSQGILRIVIDAKDAGRATHQIRAWEQAVNESRARWQGTMPSVAALYDSLKVHSGGARSTIEFTVDRTLAANSQRVINELLAAALGGLGVRASGPAAAPAAERIDTEPVAFVPTVAPASLPAYDPHAQFAEEVDQLQGPFGLRLSEIRVGAEPGVGLELVVEGFGAEIPNVGASDDRVRLSIDSVKSTGGQDLLRSEACGRERNSQPADFKPWGSHRLKAPKTLRLIEGADPRALQSVSGHAQLRLPTRTEVVSLPHPAAGAVAGKYGAIFTVTEVAGGSVSYQIAGARDRVLHFRALNAKGQPLASPSSFSSGFMFGEGVSGQKTYAGTIDRLEVVFAAEEQTLQFPFTLTDFSLAGKPGTVALDGTPPFRPYGVRTMLADGKRLALRAKPEAALAVAALDPFELSFDRAQPFYLLKLDFTLRSPDLPNFQKAFSLGQLRLTRIQLKDGTVLEPPPPAEAAAPRAVARQVWDAAVRFTSSPKDGVLSTSLSLYVDAKAKPEELKALQGVLTVQLPKTIQTLRLDDLTPGSKASAGNLTVTVAGRGRKSLTLEASKDGARVLYVRLLGADGQAVAFFSPHITTSPDGAWRFELSPLSPAVRVEVILAGDLDRKAYPFTLALK